MPLLLPDPVIPNAINPVRSCASVRYVPRDSRSKRVVIGYLRLPPDDAEVPFIEFIVHLQNSLRQSCKIGAWLRRPPDTVARRSPIEGACSTECGSSGTPARSRRTTP